MYNKKGVKNKKGVNFMKIRGKTLVVLPLCIGTHLFKVQTEKRMYFSILKLKIINKEFEVVTYSQFAFF